MVLLELVGALVAQGRVQASWVVVAFDEVEGLQLRFLPRSEAEAVEVLGALLVTKGASDPLVLIVSAAGFTLIFGGEWWFLRNKDRSNQDDDS